MIDLAISPVLLGSIGLLIGWVCGVVLYRARTERRIVEELCEGVTPWGGAIAEVKRGIRGLHEASERLQAQLSLEVARRTCILDALPLGVIVATDGGSIILDNDIARQLFPPLKLKTSPQTIEGTLRTAGITRLFEKLKQQDFVEPRDIPLLAQDNRLLRIGGTQVRRRDGSCDIIMVLEEVTERRRAERIRREFIGNVSHELRTPITALLATSEMLLEGVDDPAQEARFLGAIRRHAERLHTLIRDLLALSRLDDPAAIRQLQKDETHIADLCSSVIQTVQEAADRGSPLVSLTTTIADDVPRSAPLHKSLMQHALVNLVENAAQHVGDNGSIVLAVSRTNTFLEFSVTDNGTGISEEHLPRLFERFYRVDKGRSRQDGGSGIGLAIVKHVALAHGGSVAVKSVVSQGSTFSLTIPLPRDESTHPQ